jgi:hypothetical protein
MPHGHSINNCSLRFCREGRQLDLGESRSPVQIFQRNLLPVLVMVIIVLEVLRQVGWQRQRQRQSFHRLRAFH